MKIKYVLFACLCFISVALPADYYVTPAGTGAMDGSSWENAARGSSIPIFVNSTLNPGDRLLIGSGNYSAKIKIEKSGRDGAPVRVEGVDTGDGFPVFAGNWSTDDPGSSNGSWAAVSVGGQDHVVVRNLVITRWMYGVRSGKNPSRNIEIDNLFIHHNREGIYLKNVHESIIKNCIIEMYTKRGIRFDGDVNHVEINNVITDHNKGGLDWPQEWPFGFMIEEEPNNHNITFINCRSFNNTQARGNDYWNGDGFCAEKTARNIKYINCQSYYNADGGWDDKSRAPYLENCIAFGNKRNFRFWNIEGSENEPAMMKNCIGGYAKSPGGSGSSCGVWTRGFVTIENSTFHNNKGYAVSAETVGPNYSVVIHHSILSVTDYLAGYNPNRLTKAENGATLSLNACELYVTDKTGTNPNYVADDPAWQGDPDNAFNSQTFGPARGYWMGESNIIEYASAAPVEFELRQNYPNPFNPTTTIPYSIKKDAYIMIDVFDVNGRLVRELFHGYQTAGEYEFEWQDKTLPSGIYIYQMTNGYFKSTRSMLLVR